ncbi:glutaminyl-peptide cyclotransferase [Pseudofulvibacter geojedonensis]|uniref:Glutaminyl-peptide cyclotransferase n=1 Tax=Pseudofulvibacter geojedonensis TaxID=1123758 RepID=A0ABW3HZ14_9FLAO
MKIAKLLAITFLSILFVSCEEEEKDVNKLFQLEISNNKTQFTTGESTSFSIKNKKNKEIGTVTYSINGKDISGNKYTFTDKKLGQRLVEASFKYNDQLVVLKKVIEQVASKKPKIIKFEIVNEYPHDQNAYTQGLEFYKGELYESTGQRTKSTLRKVDYKTGNVIQKIKLDDNHFGEGLTVMNDEIYQLTWQAGIGFVYNPEDFKKIKTFKYKKSNQGWGICNDGKTLYKSDGTQRIWTLNNDTLEEEDFIEIYTNTSKINRVNELEWINGKIYANIWQKNGIAVINPETGAVEGVLNGSSLKNKVTQHPELDVLNGIAYNPETETIFVTGKNWDKLFEIKIVD